MSYMRVIAALQPKYEKHHPRGIAFVIKQIQIARQHPVISIPFAMQTSSLLMCSTNQFSQAQGVPQNLKAGFGYHLWFRIWNHPQSACSLLNFRTCVFLFTAWVPKLLRLPSCPFKSESFYGACKDVTRCLQHYSEKRQSGKIQSAR